VPAAVIVDGALVGTITGLTTGALGGVNNMDPTSAAFQFLGIARVRPTSQDSAAKSVTGSAAITTIASVGVMNTVEVDMSGVLLEGITVAVMGSYVETGDLVYAGGSTGDPNQSTTAASNADAIGFITYVYPDGNTADVKLFSAGEIRGQPAA
jgi:hypothetical protein